METSAVAPSRLRCDVQLSLHRSIKKLVVLAELDPEALLLVERHIDDWTLPLAPPEDGGTLIERLEHTLSFRPRARVRMLKAVI